MTFGPGDGCLWLSEVGNIFFHSSVIQVLMCNSFLPQVSSLKVVQPTFLNSGSEKNNDVTSIFLH